MYAVAVSEDKAGEDTGWMGGVLWDVEIEVELFLKQCCMDFCIGDRNGKVEVVDFRDSIAEYPF